MIEEELCDRITAALLIIFILKFSSKIVSLHVSPPYKEMILDLRHLWCISFEIRLGVSTVETIFFNVSNPNRDPSSGPIRLMIEEELCDKITTTLLAIFTLKFSSKIVSLHVSPPYREMIMDFRHLWFISFELSLRVSIVETIFVNVSNPKRDPSLGPI